MIGTLDLCRVGRRRQVAVDVATKAVAHALDDVQTPG
jgi:hypothetical protein